MPDVALIGVLALFGIAAYFQAQRFEREYGRTPFGWLPAVGAG